MSASVDIPYIVEPHPVTGVPNAKLGTWAFLASEVMLFGALFSSYILLRAGSDSWPESFEVLNVPLATVNTLVLIASSVTVVMAWAALELKGNLGEFRRYMGATVALAFVFLIIKYFEYGDKLSHGHYPRTHNFYAIYFTLTGLHALHVIGGIIVNSYLIGPNPNNRNNSEVMPYCKPIVL